MAYFNAQGRGRGSTFPFNNLRRRDGSTAGRGRTSETWQRQFRPDVDIDIERINYSLPSRKPKSASFAGRNNIVLDADNKMHNYMEWRSDTEDKFRAINPQLIEFAGHQMPTVDGLLLNMFFNPMDAINEDGLYAPMLLTTSLCTESVRSNE